MGSEFFFFCVCRLFLFNKNVWNSASPIVFTQYLLNEQMSKLNSRRILKIFIPVSSSIHSFAKIWCQLVFCSFISVFSSSQELFLKNISALKFYHGKLCGNFGVYFPLFWNFLEFGELPQPTDFWNFAMVLYALFFSLPILSISLVCTLGQLSDFYFQCLCWIL